MPRKRYFKLAIEATVGLALIAIFVKIGVPLLKLIPGVGQTFDQLLEATKSFTVSVSDSPHAWLGAFTYQAAQSMVPIFVIPLVKEQLIAITIEKYGFLSAYLINYSSTILALFTAFWIGKRLGPLIIRFFEKRKSTSQLTVDVAAMTDTQTTLVLFALLSIPVPYGEVVCYLVGTTGLGSDRFLKILLPARALYVLLYTLYVSLIFT